MLCMLIHGGNRHVTATFNVKVHMWLVKLIVSDRLQHSVQLCLLPFYYYS